MRYTFVVLPDDWNQDSMSVQVFVYEGKSPKEAMIYMAHEEACAHSEDYETPQEWLDAHQVVACFKGDLRPVTSIFQ